MISFPPAIVRELTPQEIIVRESFRYGIPPHLALQLAWEESRFNPFAIRKELNGSVSEGIFQVNRSRRSKRQWSWIQSVQVKLGCDEGFPKLAYWYRKTRGNWSKTVKGFRNGHL